MKYDVVVAIVAKVARLEEVLEEQQNRKASRAITIEKTASAKSRLVLIRR